jgi:fructose-1,6-bisphosphatase/inositol monophosphatase family enzyme
MSALVAAGEFAASFFGGTSPHDMAAAAVIVTEAGGRVTDLEGNLWRPFSKGIVASNGKIHDELLEVVNS